VIARQEPLLTTDKVPEGETEADRHGRVQATDGRIGHLKGFVVDPGDHRADAVASMKDGIELSITKKQVEELPGRD
jgi:hypothetical protein